MLSLDTAQKLKQAGLIWFPELNDYFAIPERNLDDKVFVISDILAIIEVLGGMQIVSFQGASEWALDYLVAADAVWLPREDKLRDTLQELMLEAGRSDLHLHSSIDGYRCTINIHGEARTFSDNEACEAYAAGLIYALHSRR